MTVPYEAFILQNKSKDRRYEFRVFNGDQMVQVIQRSYVKDKSDWKNADCGTLSVPKARELFLSLREQSYKLL